MAPMRVTSISRNAAGACSKRRMPYNFSFHGRSSGKQRDQEDRRSGSQFLVDQYKSNEVACAMRVMAVLRWSCRRAVELIDDEELPRRSLN
jgi:hypothetical protein